MTPRGVFVGLSTIDVISFVDVPPSVNQKVTARAQYVSAGGPATNAAITFAALGGDASFVTAVGEGKLADVIREDCAAHGVRLIEAEGNFPAALSSITVTPSGERSVVGADGAGRHPTFTGQWSRVLEDADVLLVDGHLPELGVPAASTAQHMGIPVVFDTGRYKPQHHDFLPLVDHVVASDDFRLPGALGASQTFAVLCEAGYSAVVHTTGAAAVRWWDGGAGEGIAEVPEVSAIDTLGAGDAFHGAYAHAIASGARVDDAVERAIGVASLRVTHEGPRDWLRFL